MDINELNDEFFTHCILNYEKGFIFLSDNGELQFKSKVTEFVRPVTPEQVLAWDKRKKDYLPCVMKNMISGIQVKAIRPINKPYTYIINSGKQNNLTLNGEALEPGDLVLMSNPPRIYDNYKVFVSECKTTKIPNLKKAVSDFKSGIRGNQYTEGLSLHATPSIEAETPMNQPISNGMGGGNGAINRPVGNPAFASAQGQAQRRPAPQAAPAKESRNWSFDQNADYKNGKLIIIKNVLAENSNTGALFHWGWELQNSETQEIVQLPDAQVMKLADAMKIKNAKAVSRNGKNILQGIGCSLDQLEQTEKK